MNKRNWLAAMAVLILTAVGGANWQEPAESALDAPVSAESGEAAADRPSDPFGGSPHPESPFDSPVSADPFAGSNSADPFGDRRRDDPFGGPSEANHRQTATDPGAARQPMLREEENNSRLMKELQTVYDGPPIVDLPMSEFFDQLEQDRGIQCWIDVGALEEEALDPDRTVVWTTTPIRLQTMLDLILEDHDLTYRIKDGILIITTMIDAEEKQELRVYDCVNLYPDPQQWVRQERPAPAASVKPTAGVSEKSGMSGGGAGAGMGAGAPPAAHPGDFLGGMMGGGVSSSQDNIEQLIHVIQSTVDPLSWEENGGPAGATIHTFRSKLVVRNTARVHNEIRYLLEELATQ